MPDLSIFSKREPVIIGEHDLSKSAVAIPFIDGPGGPALVFEVRSENLKHQPGDICFPGGGVEDGETPEEAAVREICEELLIDPSRTELIGPCDIFHGFIRYIYTYLMKLKDYDMGFSKEEVSEVFTVPLSFFLEQEPEAYKVRYEPCFGDDFPFDRIYGGKNYHWRAQEDSILFYEYEGRTIWGMTAKIVNAFAALLKEDADASE